MPKQTPAELVIGLFGVRPLARMLDIAPQTVLRWKDSKTVPSQHHVKLIQMSGGDLSAEDLVFGREL